METNQQAFERPENMAHHEVVTGKALDGKGD